MEFKLNWTRNAAVPYPNTWLTFKAKDLHSDNLVEYRICDLPENRFEDFFDSMLNDFLVNEPGNSTLGIMFKYEVPSIKSKNLLIYVSYSYRNQK